MALPEKYAKNSFDSIDDLLPWNEKSSKGADAIVDSELPKDLYSLIQKK